MGWEIRNGSRYYHRKERSAGRVRSIYVGQGAIAEMTAQVDALRLRENETQRNNERQERRAFDRILIAPPFLKIRPTYLRLAGARTDALPWRAWAE